MAGEAKAAGRGRARYGHVRDRRGGIGHCAAISAALPVTARR